MTRKLEDIVKRRRLINRANERLIEAHAQICRLREFARAIGYAVTSEEISEEVRSIYELTDSLYWALDNLGGELKLLVDLGKKF